MKIQNVLNTALVIVSVLTATNVATASEKNDKICEKEYKTEPVERTACKILGDAKPEVRDCLIRERQTTGNRGDKDTRTAEVERHVKCYVDSQSNKTQPKKGN